MRRSSAIRRLFQMRKVNRNQIPLKTKSPKKRRVKRSTEKGLGRNLEHHINIRGLPSNALRLWLDNSAFLVICDLGAFSLLENLYFLLASISVGEAVKPSLAGFSFGSLVLTNNRDKSLRGYCIGSAYTVHLNIPLV